MEGERRRFNGPVPFRSSQLAIGNEYQVRIESQSRRGDSGVARVRGLVVFVPNAKTGDYVRIRISKIAPGYGTAEIVTQPENPSEPK